MQSVLEKALFYVPQLDGEGARQMQPQQEQASKQAFKENLLKQIAINTGSNLSDMRNQNEADLITEKVNKALNTNIAHTQYDSTSQSDHDMESVYSLPLSDEVEMGDDIPHSISSLTSSSVMSGVIQSAAVADYSSELDRRRQLTQHENQQRDIRDKQQIELMRQQTASMLQEQEQAHREEATYAIEHVKNLTGECLK